MTLPVSWLPVNPDIASVKDQVDGGSPTPT
jgi:hypothetical protein